MKNKKALFSVVAMLAFSATPAMSAFASFENEKDVKVGEVDTTVYDVSVSWGDMTFDWKYNSVAEKYEFRPQLGCEINVDGLEAWQVLKEHNNLFTDSECTTLETGEISTQSGARYYEKYISGGRVTVTDNSVNGKVTATASFTPTSSYSWVTGKFGSPLMGMAYDTPIVPIGYDSVNETFSYTEITNGILPQDSGPVNSMSGYLYLEVNDMAAARAATITTDDKIGTVSIGITPNN